METQEETGKSQLSQHFICRSNSKSLESGFLQRLCFPCVLPVIMKTKKVSNIYKDKLWMFIDGLEYSDVSLPDDCKANCFSV